MSSSNFQISVPYLSVASVVLANVVLYLANERSILRLCVNRRGRLLHITNRTDGAARPEQFLCWDILNPDHMVTGTVPFGVLVVYRILALASFGFTLMYQGLWGSSFGKPPFSWLTYFTNWTYTGFGLYWVLSITILLKKLIYRPEATVNRWTFLHQASLLVFETICAAGTFLTFFYWAVLYNGGKVELDNVMRHGLNVVTLSGELLMVRLPIVSYHLHVCFVYVTTYAFFMWVYHGISNHWVYEALDWNDGNAIIYYIAIPFLVCFCFFIMYVVAWFREAVLVKRSESKYTVLEAAEVEMTGVV